MIELIYLGRRPESDKDLEILLLRRQLASYERRQERAPHLSRGEKLTLIVLEERTEKGESRRYAARVIFSPLDSINLYNSAHEITDQDVS